MATQASIQSKVALGFVKAANVLGAVNTQYRPTGSGNPLATPFATLPVLYDTNPNMLQLAPSRDIKLDDWYAGCDLTKIAAGDYLVDPTLGTFYVSAVEFFRPARCVRCNITLTVSEPLVNPQVGARPGYNTDKVSSETIFASGWPAAFAPGTKGEKNDTNLPGDVREPWFAILFPPSLPVALRNTLIATNPATGERYILSSTVQTPLGWRCSAILAST